MKRSVNELSGLLLKAGRGAGLPLGVAEDLAHAAPAMDMAALSEVCMLLDTGDARRTLIALCECLDARRCGQSVAKPPGCPALARAMGLADETVHCEPGPRDVPDAVWQVLDRYARRTYVPATEASRAGAGAALDDND